MKAIKNIVFITLLILLTVKCGKDEKTNVNVVENTTEHAHESLIEVTTKQFLNEKMELEILSNHSFNGGIKTTGMIDVPPQSKAVISSFVGGRIKSTVLLVGDKVTKGQPLVTIENIAFIELQQNYLEVTEQLAYFKAEYDRQKQLFDEKIASQKVFLKAESDYKTLNSQHLGLKKKLQLLNMDVNAVEKGNISTGITIYSPINGSISKLNITSGSYVSPTDEIMEIINNDHIHVELSVFEKDAMNIKKGQKISFKVSESSNQYFDAEVHLVGTSIDEKTRTVKVHGHLSDKDKHHFLAGMFVEAEIFVSENKVLAVPSEAVIENEGSFEVLVLKEKNEVGYIFETREVKIGETVNGFVEIKNINQFKLTDSILTKGAYTLNSTEGGGHSH